MTTAEFEAAVEAVIDGDLPVLLQSLDRNVDLIRMRSERPHRATLLHYVGANGVEDERQRTPSNAVDIARALLDAGAEIDAIADLYGGSTTLELVATSIHPVTAGVQIALLELLLDCGASMDVNGSIVNSCLANGRGQAAEFLAARGARLDLEGASGVGRMNLVQAFFEEDGSLRANATVAQRNAGFAWACQFGRTEVVALLLGKGIAVDTRLRQHNETALHWAAHGAHLDVARLLLARGAPLDCRETSFGGTPLDWALHGWAQSSPREGKDHYAMVALLVSAGATIDPALLESETSDVAAKLRRDVRMLAALRGADSKRQRQT